MADNRGTLEEATGRAESQAHFTRSLVELLKQHRAVLPTLPEMFERFIDMESNETSDTQNSDLSREGELPISEKRKKTDLLRHYRKELAEKDVRIVLLESELRGKTLELKKLSEEEEKKIASWRNNYRKIEEQLKKSIDGYFKAVDALNEEKEELMERISSLQNDLTAKDKEIVLITANKEEQIQEYKNRFDKLKEQYEEAVSRKDQDLKELNFGTLCSYEDLNELVFSKDEQVRKYEARNEDLTQQIRTKEEQVKAWEAKYNELAEAFKILLANKDKELKEEKTRYNQLTEECKVLLANKDEELKGMKTSNDDLTQQINTKDGQVKQCETRYSELKERCKVIVERKDEELKQMKTRYSEFKERCKVLVEKKDEELKKMKTRLACLSEKQLQKDQRKVEDTTSSNRPSEVEKDFTAFYDEDRMDACEKMQKVYGSEEESEVGNSYPRLACMIFETAYEEMKETKEAVLALFKVITKNMIDMAPKMGVEYVSRTKSGRLPYNPSFSVIPYKPELEYPTDVFDALVLSLKETAHKCDLESLERGVTRKIKDKWLQWLTKETSCRFSVSEYLLLELKAYIEACMRLTWRMVTQVPPMQLEYQSSTLRDIQKNIGYHSSPEMCSRRPTTEGQASDEELESAFYLWPALLDGGGKLIHAGKVVCNYKVKEEITKI